MQIKTLNRISSSLFTRIAIAAILVVTVLGQSGIATAATYTATQTGWGGGVSAGTITHNPVNGVTSWGTQYSAKDTNIAVVGGGGDLELSAVSTTTTQTTDTDFNAGTKTQTLVSGSGSAAVVELAKNAVSVSGGNQYSLALKSDGTVWAWGGNDCGQLGDGTATQRLTPVQVSGLTGVIAVSAGNCYSLAIKSDGTAWGWGQNGNGQLGDGTGIQSYTPVQVSGLTGVVAVAAGYTHSLAVKSDGTVWSWGLNQFGQLGDGTVTQRLAPVQVSGLTGMTAIGSGVNFSLAVKSDGTVWSWGYNGSGQLGDGGVTNRSTPGQVSGLTGAVAAGGGNSHSYAVKSDGTVWSWGLNSSGQLGDGTVTQRLTPVQASGLTGVVAMDSYYHHAVAVKSDGTVWTWGQNASGQLGDGTTTQRNSPIQASGLTGVVAVSGGSNSGHSLALKSDGTVWGWGYNFNGQLGDNTTTNRSTPVQTVATGGGYFSYGSYYKTSGTFVSSVIDTGSVSNFTTITYATTTPATTSITMDVRSGNTATPDGTWTAWQTSVASGGSIATQNGHRYFRYRANLASTNGVATPQLNSVTIAYSAYPTSQTLTSVAYDSGSAANLLNKIQWTASTTAVAVAKFQVRTSADNNTWTAWYGPTGTSSYFTSADGTQTMPSIFTAGNDDRYFQYKTFLTSDGTASPSLSDATLTYIVNAPPQFDSVATTTAAQIASSTDPNWGKVLISYSVRDTDTTSGSFTPGYVTPSFEYNVGGGWIAIATSSLAVGDTSNKAVNGSTYTSYTATWDAKSQIPETYTTNMQVRVTVSDNEPANASAQSTSGVSILDSKNPVTALSPSDAANGIISYSATDDSLISYRLSNNADLTADSLNANSGNWVNASASMINASSSWTFTGDPSYQTAYFQVRDTYGNVATMTNAVPMRPGSLDIKDTTNLTGGNYREFLSWKTYTATSTANFSRYEIWRSENGGTFSLYHTINTADGGPTLNYFTDTVVASSTTYTYKLRVVDTDGDISPWASNVPSDLPDGQGGTDFTPPTITSPLLADRQATWAKITFTTDELAFGSVVYKKSDGSGLTTASSSSLGTDHVVVLSNLTPGVTYLYKIVADDIFGNEATIDNGGAWYSFIAKSGPRVSDVTSVLTDDKNATVVWNTDTDANSSVTYATNIAALNTATGTVVTNASLVGGPPYQHRVNLTNLSPRTTYWYYVSSTDSDGNTTIDKNNLSYYSFTTSYDQKSPVISAISVPVAAPNSIVVYWKTDELANASLSLGTASSTYSTTADDAVMSITHAVAASGLAANTTYHYRVTSCDPVGNCASSDDQVVTTAQDGEVRIVTIGGGSGSGQFAEASTPKDTTVPTITSIQVATTTAFGATITFDTNEPTIAFLEYGKDTAYNLLSGSKSFATHHEVSLSGLRIGTDYHYRAKVFDRAANEAASADQTFKTKFVTDAGENLTTIEDIRAYEQLTEDSIEAILPSIRPPFVEEPRVVDTTENTATIRWRTNINAYAGVLYSEEGEYGATSTTPYTEELSQVMVKEKEHTMTLVGLKPNTKYHFMARSFSIPEVVGSSKDMTFITKAPKVSASIIDVKNTSFRVIWSTEQPASTIVEYKNVKTGTTERIIEDKPVTYHDLLVDNALPATSYEVRVFGYGANGNLIESGAVLTVLTSRDISAPKIANFKVDGALVPGRTDRVQTVITWTTDEISNSAVYFQEGAGAVKDFTNKDEELDTYTTNHAIILSNLKPGTIYQMKLESVDQAGNKATFGPRTIITPQKGESIFDVIFKNFEDTFKFLRGAGQ